MNICVIGRARTRSSIFCASVAKYYGLQNFNEYYAVASAPISNPFLFRNLSQEEKDTLTWNHYKKGILKVTEEMFITNHFVTKLWPRWFIQNFQGNRVISEDLTEFKTITNLQQYFKILDYDKIYWIDRPVIDSICSLSFVYTVHKFHSTISTLDKPIFINTNHRWVQHYLFDILISKKLKLFLNDNNIECNQLTYDDVPNYCIKNYAGIEGFEFKDGHRNYKNLISNYAEVEEYIDTFLKDKFYLVENIKFNL